MPRVQLPQELQNIKLVSKLKSSGQLYSIHVLPKADSPVPRTANTAYIKMDLPDKLNGFSLYANGQRIGSLRFEVFADMGGLNRVDNHAQSQFKGVGQAMEEMTCRLTRSLCKSSEVGLYSELNATLFHFKMGFRFENNTKNDYIKSHIRNDSLKHINKDRVGYGDMYLDFGIPETTPDSPRLLNRLLAQTPALLEPTTLEL